MPVSYIIHGAASIRVGFGVAGPVGLLGLTQNGVDIAEQYLTVPINTDVAGPAAPADEQYVGEIAMISAELTAVDLNLFEAMKRYAKGIPAGLGSGLSPARGSPIHATNRHFRILLPSQVDPRRYLCARWTNSDKYRRGTVHSVYQFEFLCWAPMIPAPAISQSVNFSGFNIAPLYDSILV